MDPIVPIVFILIAVVIGSWFFARFLVLENIAKGIGIFTMFIGAIGIIVPLVISFLSLYAGELSIPLMVIAIICHTAGAFALKFGILKVGIHKPIVPKNSIHEA